MPLNWGFSSLVVFTIMFVLMLSYSDKMEISDIVECNEVMLESKKMMWCW